MQRSGHSGTLEEGSFFSLSLLQSVMIKVCVAVVVNCKTESANFCVCSYMAWRAKVGYNCASTISVHRLCPLCEFYFQSIHLFICSLKFNSTSVPPSSSLQTPSAPTWLQVLITTESFCVAPPLCRRGHSTLATLALSRPLSPRCRQTWLEQQLTKLTANKTNWSQKCVTECKQF